VPKPLPPPLPPRERTVGQLIAESIRLYGRRFWPSLLLGVPLAAFDQLALDRSSGVRALVFLAATPFFAVTYAFACRLALERPVTWRAVALGTAVLLPVSLVISWFALLVAAYLALVGLVVPVAMAEGTQRPLRRAVQLGRADYIHALGSLAALVILFYVARIGLVALLRAQAENTIRVAVALADVVVSPLVFLGSALLYVDQAARINSNHPTRRSRDADLSAAVDADRAGRPNAEVQP
jgi:hypothetical protein